MILYNKRYSLVLLFLLIVGSFKPITPSFLEYIWPTDNDADTSTDVDTLPSVPYEVSDGEESFIREAARWLSTNLSKLDLCHHRVILKLKKSCHELNGEQLGKLAVLLLNCQSDSEGRPVFPCTDEMSLHQCTERMDPNTWNTYHLITNRAKAVCASVRHEQFRGLTELTVNKLMSTAQEQVRVMDDLTVSQLHLQTIAQRVTDELAGNSERIVHQQADIMKLSEVHRAKVESNYRDLVREKALIKASQQEVALLLTDMRNRIDDSMALLEVQSKHSKVSHASLLTDLERLQASAAAIALKMDEAGAHLAQHHAAVEEQYRYTVEQLQRINGTVASMLESIRNLQHDFNRQLAWLVEKIGGSEKILPKLNIILLHVAYLLLGMICLAFVGADKLLRVVFIAAVPGNLIGGLLELFEPDVLRLSVALGCVAVVDLLTRLVTLFLTARTTSKQPLGVGKSNQTHSEVHTSATNGRARPAAEESDEESDHQVSEPELRRRESFTREKSTSSTVVDAVRRSVSRLRDDFRERSVTPGERLFAERQHCAARTLRGDRCRGFALTGMEFCRLHEPRGL